MGLPPPQRFQRAGLVAFLAATVACGDASASIGLAYQGRLNRGVTPAIVRAHFVSWARRNRVGAVTDVGKGRTGVRLVLHPAGRGVDLVFDADGAFSARVETSDVGPGYHMAVVSLLDALRRRFARDLNVRDESGYWSHRKRELLVEVMLRHSIVLLEKALGKWPKDPMARLSTPIGEFDLRSTRQWLAALKNRRDLDVWFIWWPSGREGAYWTQLGCAIYFTRFMQGSRPADAKRALKAVQRYFDRGRAAGWETWLSRYYQGLMQRDAERLDAAISWYRGALELNPGQPDVTFALGEVCLEANRLAEAEKIFEALATELPASPEARYRVALARSAQGKYKEALIDLDQTLRLDPLLAAAWAEKGLALRKLGRPMEALASLEMGIKLDPKNVTSWYNRGVTLSVMGLPAEAEICLRQCLALNPTHYDALVELGLAQLGQEKLGESVATFRRATQLSRRRPEAFFNLGRVYEQMGREIEAKRAFDEARRRGLSRREATRPPGKTP